MIIKNMLKSVYKLNEYEDFLKAKIPYCIFYVFILSLFMSFSYTDGFFYRYYVKYGGAKAVISELVPDFTISRDDGLYTDEVIKRSITVNSGDSVSSILNYIIDTSVEDLPITKKQFKERYNYSGEDNAPLVFVSKKRTYIVPPNELKDTENAHGITSFSNYYMLNSLGISSKADIMDSCCGFLDTMFYTFIISIIFSIFFGTLIMVLYFSVMLLLFLRMTGNTKIKFFDAFRISSFGITGAVLFSFMVTLVHDFAIIFYHGEINIRQVPFTVPAIFIMYMFAVFKENKALTEDVKKAEISGS